MCALYVSTTPAIDQNNLAGKSIDSPEFKQFIVQLYQYLNGLAISSNSKDSGIYDTTPTLSGQAFFPDPVLSSSTSTEPSLRNTLRLVVDFGALPDARTKSVPHGITLTAANIFTRIYATATDPVDLSYIPIPYASSTTANIVELNVDDTFVNITTNGDDTAYTICYVILEWI